MQRPCSPENRGTVRRLALGALAATATACLLVLASPAPAEPDEGRDTPRQHFLSGGERSVAVLREIKDVLERIDSRLVRLEDKLSRIEQRAPQGNPGVAAENTGDGER